MAYAKRLRLRLFIEGVEVPCVSAVVQAVPNSPMTASIQILPLAEGTRLLPRSLVHVFFYDYYEDASPNIKATGLSVRKKPGPSVYDQVNKRADKRAEDGHVTTPSAVEDQSDDDLNLYKLIFVGEVVGFRYSKGAVNRALILQCLDLSNYWDYAYQYNNTDLFGPGLNAVFSGGSTNLFTDFLDSPSGIATQLLLSPSSRYPALGGLLGGLIHVLEAMGGSYYSGKKYHGQNIFFSLAELRLHISQLITAYEKDDTSQRLLGGSYDPLFGRTIGNLGDQASFRKIVNVLSGSIFHETFPQPCPMYVPGTSGTISGYERKRIQQIPALAAIVAAAVGLVDRLNEVVDSVNSVTRFSKLTKKDKAEAIKAEWSTQSTKIRNAQSTCKQQARKAEQAVTTLKTSIYKLAAPLGTQCAKIFKAVDVKLSQVYQLLRIAGVRTSTSPDKKALEILNKAISQLREILELECNITATKDAVPAVLKQQIIRPDVWFSAPPRCNVLFPENYGNLDFSRSFMAEPTRLLLKMHDEFFGEDELFDTYCFAPKAITVKGEKNTLSAILRNDVLDHELFTGILPVFEKMGEFNIFAIRSGMTDGKKKPKVGLAQRSANFMYFKYRFAARQLQISGKFNPYLAVGFPGLIIDKYLDVETLKLHNELKKQLPDGQNYQTRLPNLLGTHFLASFTEVTHQVDQQQGTTSINGSYARQVEESVEFLGVEQEEVSVSRVQKKQGAVRTTEVASVHPPRVGEQGPNQGRITAVVDTTSKHTNKTLESASRLPLYRGKRDKKTSQLSTIVPVGVAGFAKDFGPDVVEQAGDANITVVIRSYNVTETKAIEYNETVFLPPEEYIRPGWYGNCWRPSFISDVYYDFFNIGAITEPLQIQNTEGRVGSGVVSSSAEEVLKDIAGDSQPFSRDALLVLSQTKGSSIQDAATYLIVTYSLIKQAGYDVDEFIRSYTWRPIATLLDMFGSTDLQLDPTGREVVSGFEGFHSRAFGDFNDLFGLVTPDIVEVLGIDKGSPQAKRADTRKRKRQQVLDYIAVLRLSRGILG
jgi:hypothetical protein